MKKTALLTLALALPLSACNSESPAEDEDSADAIEERAAEDGTEAAEEDGEATEDESDQ